MSQPDELIETFMQVLEDAENDRRKVWVSLDGKNGWEGIPERVALFVFALMRSDGRKFYFSVLDVRGLLGPGNAETDVSSKKQKKGSGNN